MQHRQVARPPGELELDVAGAELAERLVRGCSMPRPGGQPSISARREGARLAARRHLASPDHPEPRLPDRARHPGVDRARMDSGRFSVRHTTQALLLRAFGKST